MADSKTGGRLEGKVALISGGARGLGEAFGRAMVAEGAKVVLGDVLHDLGQAVARDIGADDALYVQLDVTDRDQWAAAVSATVGRFGKLNVLVNNAGVGHYGSIGEFKPADWDNTIAIDLTGTFNGIHASVAALVEGAPSSIINISSTAGMQGFASMPAYNASKFGVRGLTKSVALDLAAANVRCNSVHPGVVKTPLTAPLALPQKHVAMHRQADPAEIAKLIVFLASDEASFSTGSEFIADGGETTGLAPDAGV